MRLQIDTDIPIPVVKRTSKYPFEDMGVGDSIFFAQQGPAFSARVAAIRFTGSHRPEWRFTLRKASDGSGWRLWRVK